MPLPLSAPDDTEYSSIIISIMLIKRNSDADIQTLHTKQLMFHTHKFGSYRYLVSRDPPTTILGVVILLPKSH